MLQALKHRNFRIFIWGQGISLVGTWMQQIALGWLVYRMTNSAFLLGVVGFSGQIATFVLAPLAGVIADRHHRHRLLLVTQVAAMLQAIILAALVLTNTITVWEIIVLSLMLGVVNAFDLPVRQSFIADMVTHHDDLGNAIALNSSMVNAARLVGPSIGGVLIATVGEGICILLNAISYLAVIASLLMMRIPKRELGGRGRAVWHELKEGFHYSFSFMPIRTILLLLSVVSLVAGGVQVLMPVFARDIFHGGAQMLGFLMGSTGLGALAGAVYLAGRKTVLGLGKVIVYACLIFGVSLLIFIITPPPLAVVLLAASGFGMIVQMASSNMILQSMVEESKRGRVMSFYTMAFMGMSPFGSLIAGGLAHRWGAVPVLFVGGILVIVSAGLFALQLSRLRELVRPLYIQKGILSEIVQ